jgi:hypothetical protein
MTTLFPLPPKDDDPLEKEIEAAVKDYARSKGILCYKFSSPSHASVPDDLFLYEGRAFFIEFKRKGKLPTPAQLREHTRIRQQGVLVWVVDSEDAGRRVINAFINVTRYFRDALD